MWVCVTATFWVAIPHGPLVTVQVCPAPPLLEDLTFLVLVNPKVNENGEAEPSQDRSSSSPPRSTFPEPSGLCLTDTGLSHQLPREGGHLAGLHLIQPGVIRVWKTLNPTPGSCQQHRHRDSFWLGTNPRDFTVGETGTALICLQQSKHPHSLPDPGVELGPGLGELVLGMWSEGHRMPPSVLHLSSCGARDLHGAEKSSVSSRTSQWKVKYPLVPEDIILHHHVRCTCQVKHQRGELPIPCAIPNTTAEPNTLLCSLDLFPPIRAAVLGEQGAKPVRPLAQEAPAPKNPSPVCRDAAPVGDGGMSCLSAAPQG